MAAAIEVYKWREDFSFWTKRKLSKFDLAGC